MNTRSFIFFTRILARAQISPLNSGGFLFFAKCLDRVQSSQTIPNAELVTVEGGEHRIDERFAITAAPAIQKFLKE